MWSSYTESSRYERFEPEAPSVTSIATTGVAATVTDGRARALLDVAIFGKFVPCGSWECIGCCARGGCIISKALSQYSGMPCCETRPPPQARSLFTNRTPAPDTGILSLLGISGTLEAPTGLKHCSGAAPIFAYGGHCRVMLDPNTRERWGAGFQFFSFASFCRHILIPYFIRSI